MCREIRDRSSCVVGFIAPRAPWQAAQFLGERPGSGLAIAMRPTVEPLLVVQEELPVADDSMPHEQKRHGRLEWSEARVIDGSPLVAFVERPEQDSIFHIRRNCKLPEYFAKDALGTICCQVGEDNDDYLVVRTVTINWLSAQELRLAAVYELDHI